MIRALTGAIDHAEASIDKTDAAFGIGLLTGTLEKR